MTSPFFLRIDVIGVNCGTPALHRAQQVRRGVVYAEICSGRALCASRPADCSLEAKIALVTANVTVILSPCFARVRNPFRPCRWAKLWFPKGADGFAPNTGLVWPIFRWGLKIPLVVASILIIGCALRPPSAAFLRGTTAPSRLPWLQRPRPACAASPSYTHN
jgi:hypothetical protein